MFLRSAGCPLRCSYCDTVESYNTPPQFEVRDLKGDRLAQLPNPVASEVILSAAWFQPRGAGCWLSMTGGEPLLWSGPCREILEGARPRGFRTLLETAALDPKALEEVLPGIDHLSLDYKLPSTLLSGLAGGMDLAEAHKDCLRLAIEAKVETSLKMVLTPRVDLDELYDGLKRIQPFRHDFCLVLQPVTPCLDELEPLAPAQLLERVELALDMDFRIRVLPQIHKSLGLA